MSNQFQSVSTKLLLLGNYSKFQTFSPPLHIGVKHTKQHTLKKSVRTGRSLKRSASQKRTRLFNIGLCNITHTVDSRVKFLTLTLAEPQFNHAFLSRMFTKFIMRLEYKLGYKVKYIGVTEKHDSIHTIESRRGSYHIHAIFFNIPFLPHEDYQKLWKHGFTYIKAINADATHKGLSYVLKYLTDEQILNSRVFMPRHMSRPVSIYNTLRPCLTPIYESSTIIYDTIVPTTISTSLYKN